MSSTVDWLEEISSEFQTDGYSTDVMTTSSGSYSTASISLTPYKSLLASIAYLGTFTNGLVLFGFWRSDRSKLTSTSVHIINHTTLELSTSLWTCSKFYYHHFLDPALPTYIFVICNDTLPAFFMNGFFSHCHSWPVWAQLLIRPLSWLLV